MPAPMTAPPMVAASRPRPLPIWWPMTAPIAAPSIVLPGDLRTMRARRIATACRSAFRPSIRAAAC